MDDFYSEMEAEVKADLFNGLLLKRDSKIKFKVENIGYKVPEFQLLTTENDFAISKGDTDGEYYLLYYKHIPATYWDPPDHIEKEYGPYKTAEEVIEKMFHIIRIEGELDEEPEG